MAGRPAASQSSRACPPFHARVVKPRISVLTPHRSSVRAMMSALIAAMLIGRPRIDPLLSINSVTTVSRKLDVALDLVRQRASRRDDHARQPRGVEHAFFLIEIPAAVLLRHQAALQPVGKPGYRTLQVRQVAGRDRRAAG